MPEQNAAAARREVRHEREADAGQARREREADVGQARREGGTNAVREPTEREPGADAEREPTERKPGADAERARMEGEFLLAMRRTGSTLQLLGQLAAERIGVNATDLNCLNLVALAGPGEPMTAGELARQTGLTTASITGVLDRLEEGGFVRRERDPKDRRRVNVTLNLGPALAGIGPTFGPLVMAWRAAAASYSDEDLRLLVEFQGRFLDIVRDQLGRLRGEA